MIEVRYISYFEQLDDRLFKKLLKLLPDRMSQRILRYARWQDAHAALLGKVLLQNQIKEMHLDLSLNELKYTSFGRPYYNDHLDFNISHSGGLVVIVISKNCKVGVDIEFIAPLNLQDYQTQFVEEEWTDIINSHDAFSRFYYYWTAKEAIVKANGRGLSIPLRDVIIKHGISTIDNTCWYYKKIDISKQYVVHLASDKNLVNCKVHIKSINISELQLDELILHM